MYRHIKTNKPYFILKRTKVKIDGIWKDAIVYVCLYFNKDGMVWVRLKEDFELNFKK